MIKLSPSSRTSKTAKPSSRNTSSTKRTMPRIAVIILGIILVVLFFMAMGGRVMKTGEPNGEMSAEQKKMEAYLEEKYGEEFVVGDIHLEGAGLGVTGAVVANAYPNIDPSLQFKISRLKNSNNYERDSFLEIVWSKESKEEVEKFLKKEIPDIKSFAVKVSPGFDLYDSIKGEIPKFSEVRKKFPRSFGYMIAVSSALVAPSTNTQPTEIELNRAYKLVTYMQDQHIVNPEVYYSYRSNDFNVKNKDGDYYDKYIFSLKGESALTSINNTDDLRKFFDLTYVAKQGDSQ